MVRPSHRTSTDHACLDDPLHVLGHSHCQPDGSTRGKVERSTKGSKKW